MDDPPPRRLRRVRADRDPTATVVAVSSGGLEPPEGRVSETNLETDTPPRNDIEISLGKRDRSRTHHTRARSGTIYVPFSEIHLDVVRTERVHFEILLAVGGVSRTLN